MVLECVDNLCESGEGFLPPLSNAHHADVHMYGNRRCSQQARFPTSRRVPLETFHLMKQYASTQLHPQLASTSQPSGGNFRQDNIVKVQRCRGFLHMWPLSQNEHLQQEAAESRQLALQKRGQHQVLNFSRAKMMSTCIYCNNGNTTWPNSVYVSDNTTETSLE